MLIESKGFYIGNHYVPSFSLEKGDFPKGVSYDKEEGVYRTPAVNSVLSVFSDISGDYKEYINKKESHFCDSFSLVAETGFEPMTFGL